MIANQYFAGMRKDFDRQSIMDKYGTFGLDSLFIYVLYSWQGHDLCVLCPTFVMRILQIEIGLYLNNS